MELPPAEALRPPPKLTPAEVAGRAGVDVDFARRVWRALGMPDIPDDEVALTDEDVEALVALNAIRGLGFSDDEMIAVTRVYGTALSRIADVETRLFRERVLRDMEAAGVTVEEVTDRLVPIVAMLQDATSRLLDQGHRRHLYMAQAALERSRTDTATETLATGFVDLVDFSRISGDLPGEELGGMIDAFEHLAVEVCSDTGVRLVKVIGDAVMFVARDPTRALEAGREVVRGAETTDVLPQARAGLDFGEVTPMAGDYFGRPVNVAARITAFAYPGTVVVSRELLDGVGADGVTTSRIGTERLKGVGRVELFKVKDD